MKKLISLFASILIISSGLYSISYAAPDPVIRNSVAVCDPNAPTHCAAPSSSGAIPVVISGGGASTSVTAASGAYVAGSIVDIGTGATPAANTVNANLKALAPQSLTLLTNASTSGAAQTNVTGGAYIYSVSGTFGSATNSLVVTQSGYATTYGPVAQNTGNICVYVPQGATVQATIAGSGATLNATLSGSSGCITVVGAYPQLPVVAIADGNTGLYANFSTGTAGVDKTTNVGNIQGCSACLPLTTQSAPTTTYGNFTPLTGTGILASGTTDGLSTLWIDPTALATGAGVEVDFSYDGLSYPTVLRAQLFVNNLGTQASLVANNLYGTPVLAKYFRIYQNAYTSGTTTGVYWLTANPYFIAPYPAAQPSVANAITAGQLEPKGMWAACLSSPVVPGNNSSGALREDCTDHGLWEHPIGSQSWTTAQASVTTSATLIAAARAGRYAITLVNEGTNICHVGPTSSVSATNGLLLLGTAGTSLTINTQSAIYGICAATDTVDASETY